MNIIKDKHSISLVFTLWVALFCFAIVMGLLFQKLILPNIPSLHAGFGLMKNDAIYFHQVAEVMAVGIQTNGWSWAAIWPDAVGARGNVALLAILYALFGTDPSLVLPINAILHATSGILIYSIIKLLCPSKVGQVSGVIAAVIFVVFPSSLTWYAQVHKDTYAILGTLLVLYTWLSFFKFYTDKRSVAIFVMGSIVGMLLILFVRPYNIIFLTVATTVWLLAVALISVVRSSWQGKGRYFFVTIFVWMIFIMGALTFSSTSSNPYSHSDTKLNVGSSQFNEVCSTWHWQKSSWLPASVEKYAEIAARTRVGLICASFDAPSNIDRERLPNNIVDIVTYMPRVMMISLLAPFPENPQDISMMRLAGALEMLIWYLLIPGVFLAIKYHRSEGMMLCFLFSLCYLAIYGFTIGNMGTLYRFRYPFLMIFMAVGILGWSSLLNRKGILEKINQFLEPTEELHLNESLSTPTVRKNRKQAISLGIYVVVLTFLGFIGFFYRDILMAHIFGLGVELDGFFIAILIPMTIVTIVCIPLGSALTPVFIAARENASKKEVQNLISSLSGLVLAVLSMICISLHLLVPYLIPYVVDQNTIGDMTRVSDLTRLALLILLFSGPVIIANTILNALGKVVTTGMAQLVVPVVAIFILMISGEQYGVKAVIVGMIVGQLINLLIVQIKLKKSGYTLLPQYEYLNRKFLLKLTSQYPPLVASAFFVGVAILVNTILATQLSEGSVSVFNLGNKVVLLLTGLIGAAISTVMLPYFSSLVAKNHVVAARRELSVFLLFITLFSIPVSVIFFVWAEPIVRLIFEGGKFDSNSIDMVARVLQYSVVQIPFFSCNILLLKFATATKHVMAILLVAIVGLLINVAASLFFMKHMGVAGIALGASLSMIIATISLVLILVRYRHVGIQDMVALLLNWLLFVTLLVSVHYASISGIVITIFTYLILLAGYSKSLFSDTGLMRVG